MSCIVEFSEPKIRFDFTKNQYKQKIWIEALLKFTQVDINKIATLLELPINRLVEVHQGRAFFTSDSVDRLAKLFLVAFSD
ncbi:MAG: hypothetical protein H0U57_13285 [Tatlockia sp.]|nr:hypothetical protein [Tatlockia sp.]